MSESPVIVWFRNDLRLTDNRALMAAIACGAALIPLFIWSPEEENSWAPGAASQWWLHQSLQELSLGLEAVDSGLILRKGPVIEILESIIREHDVKMLFFNRRYEPWARVQENAVEEAMLKADVALRAFNSSLLIEPRDLLNREGLPYKVFTPFWKAMQKSDPLPALKGPEKLVAHPSIDSLVLDELSLLPSTDWAGGMRATWRPGEKNAVKCLKTFLDEGISNYANGRDRPDQEYVSRLSPYLHFGEISPRLIWHAVKHSGAISAGSDAGSEAYLRELAWREFAYYLLVHFPNTTDSPLRPQFEKFPWRQDQEMLTAWQKGKTGYPIVDAGMRQLWATGWMHNRVRMITASFLVKHLLLPWQAGAKWFWDTLVDADLANNTFGWQWTAGCGADAAPYFRIFNPILQGKKFDPSGDYVKLWVPELRGVDTRWIHNPWEAPAGIPEGIYSNPIVEHDFARKRALAAFETLKAV